MIKTFKNLCWHATSTVGTGTLTLGPVLTGFASLTTFDNFFFSGAKFNYVLRQDNDYEIGVGTFNFSAKTLTRELVSSSTGALLNLSGAGATVAIGDVSDQDLAILRGARQFDLGGSYITGLGLESLSDSTSGINTLALGPQSLRSLTSGGYNVAVGNYAGQDVTTGSGNLLLGNYAGRGLNPTDALIIENANSGVTDSSHRLIHGSFDANDPHFSPGSDDVIDLGIQERRWRNLKLSGTLTSQYISSSSSVITLGAIQYDTLQPNLTQGKVFAYSSTSGKMEPREGGDLQRGGALSRLSATILTISQGIWTANDFDVLAWGPSAISLDITSAGTFVNSSSRATNTWYHVLVGRETSSGNVVGGLSTTLAKPSGWDNWQMLGACRTDGTGSGNLWDIVNDLSNPNFFYRPDLNPNVGEDYTFVATSAAAQTVRALCPPMSCRVVVFGRWLDPALSNPYAQIDFKSASSLTNVAFSCFLKSSTNGSYFGTVHTDSSGQYFISSTASITYTQLLGFTQGFYYPRGQAGYV